MKLYAIILSFLIFGSSTNAFSAESVTFGDKPTHASDSSFDYALSPDKKAFTIVFSRLEAVVDEKNPPAPIVTKSFSMALPVHGAKKLSTKFYFQGFALATKGADCSLIITINGKTKTFSFKPGTDGSFLKTVAIDEARSLDIRMTINLVTARAGGSDGVTHLILNTIDTDLVKAKARKPKKK
jgi:hypothetical protein